MRVIGGRIITTSCQTTQTIEEIKNAGEKKTKIPTVQQRLTTQSKIQKDEKTSADINMKDETTIGMTLRLQGGMKSETSAASTETLQERRVNRITSESCSEISELNEIKLNDIHRTLNKRNRQRLKKIERTIGNYHESISAKCYG